MMSCYFQKYKYFPPNGSIPTSPPNKISISSIITLMIPTVLLGRNNQIDFKGKCVMQEIKTS